MPICYACDENAQQSGNNKIIYGLEVTGLLHRCQDKKEISRKMQGAYSGVGSQQVVA
jgi:hypothetical protein